MHINDALAANFRSARARKQLYQADVSERMRALGYTSWRRQTVATVEKGERRLTAEEIFGLAFVFETSVMSLMDLSGNGAVLFPNDRDILS